MADSFQKEIPKARVNIALEVETGGATEKKELPMKMLAVGDFSNGKTEGRVLERERINVHKNNLDQVMKDLSPEINLNVENKIKNDGSDLGINLKFGAFEDFHPEKIAEAIPETKRILAMRNLLKDLKSNLLDNTTFRKELEAIMQDEASLQGLRTELEGLVENNES
tara:strand:+ start:16031 stop:16531 length:501 start_codon:yes stop_codon:yes gene_type:complete